MTMQGLLSSMLGYFSIALFIAGALTTYPPDATGQARPQSLISGSPIFSPIFENGVLQPDRAKITLGEFSVGRTGAATFAIPIMVPPGTAGMQPNLSLTYNSQAGNGLAGVGWRLTGLSAIARCRQSIAQDGQNGAITFSASDRFCLDGLRLIAVSGSYGADGTEYRTEKDSFVKVTSHGAAGSGPEYFRVKTKEGRTLEYGNSADSRIEATGSPSARVWALNKVQDASGNHMTVSYLESDGDFRPAEINYTINTGGGLTQPSRRVLFSYEMRSDAPMRFVGGARVEMRYRLTSIKTFAEVAGTEAQVRDYRIAYDASTTYTNRSRVLTITECVTSSCGDHKPFELEWSDSETPSGNFQKELQSSNFGQVVNGDFNGDGRVDFLAKPSTAFKVFRSTAGTGDDEYVEESWGSGGTWNANKSWRGDFDGDGLTDMLTNVGDTFYTYFSTGAAFSSAVSGGSGDNEMLGWSWTGDFDGDGRSDILTLAQTGTTILTHLSQGDGNYTEYGWTRPSGARWSGDKDRFWIGDTNGDRMADLLSYRDGNLHIYRSRGDGAYSHSTFAVSDAEWSANFAWLGDYNGDGLIDLVSKKTLADDFNTYFSKGDGTFTVVNFVTPAGAGWAGKNVWVGDFNGDGLTDLMSKKNGYFHKYFSKGNGEYSYFGAEAFTPDHFDEGNAWTGDVDGDGLLDVVSYTGSNATYTYFTNEIFPDLLTSITNPLKGEYLVTYTALTDTTVYTKADQAVYPTADVALPIYVVAEYTASNGCENEDNCGRRYDFSYAYEGLKFDLEGRGNLGFQKVRMEDLSGTNVVTETIYLQQFPFEGLLDTLAISDSGNGKLLQQVQNTWVEHQPNGSHPVVFAALEAVDTFECDGASNCRTVSRTMAYDEYGNQEKTIYEGILSKTGDEYEEETIWAVDPVNWLHRPSTKIIKDFDGSELRRSWFYYDGNNAAVGQLGGRGLRTREEHDLGGGQGHTDNPKTTAIYDAFGNRQSVTDPLGCITTWVYDQTKTYPISETSCLADNSSQATRTFEWDERWGVKLSETDANGNATEYRYGDSGQIEMIIGPLDTEFHPLREFHFNPLTYAKNHYVQTRQPIRHNWGHTPYKYEYFDGLGRVWFEKSRHPQNSEVSRIIEYDSRNLVRRYSDLKPWSQAIIDGYDNFTTYTYDPLGRLTRVLFPDNTTIRTSYAPDATTQAMVVEVTDRRGNKKRRFLDAYGRVIKVEEDNVEDGTPVTYVTGYTYNALGQLLTTENHLGHASTIRYDKLGRKTAHDDPDAGKWYFPEYDEAGNLKAQVDAKGQVILSEYDLSGRITRKNYQAAPYGGGSEPLVFKGLVRDRVGRGKTALSADGYMDGVFTVSIPEDFGAKTVTGLKLTRSAGGEWNTNPATGHWVAGAAHGLDDPLFNAADGSASFGVYPGASFNLFVADDRFVPLFTAGLTFTLRIDFSDGTHVIWNDTIDPSPTISLAFEGTSRDRVGRGKTALSADGSTDGVFTVTLGGGFGTKTITGLKMTRSAGGQWNTDPATRHWVAGAALGLDDSLLNAADGSVNFSVVSGQSFTVFVADDAIVPLFTEGLSFTLEVGFSDGSSTSDTFTAGSSIVWTYDDPNMSNAIGRLTKVTDLVGTETYAYDAMGRVSEQARTIGTTTYTIQQKWNALNKLDSKTYPDGDTVNFTYNAAGWLSRISDIVHDVHYNPRGQISYIRFDSWTRLDREYYDDSFRLKRSMISGVQDLEYDYDAKGNVTRITDYIGTASRDFIYDALDRLIEAAGPFGGIRQTNVTETYAYDAVGNFTEKAGVTYHYNGLNNRVQTTQVGSVVQKTFTYDENGNIKQNGGEDYQWDPDNRLISVNGSVAFAYDYTGRRLSKDSVLYPFADYEIDSSGVQKKYFTFNGELVGAKKGYGPSEEYRFYHTDHLGGTHVITGSDGLIDQVLEYDPWGRISRKSTTLDNVKMFTSQEYDAEVDLYYYVGRYYDPVLGRFTRPDPLVAQPFNPQNLNRYSYVLNNPTNLTDPTGFNPFENADRRFSILPGVDQYLNPTATTLLFDFAYQPNILGEGGGLNSNTGVGLILPRDAYGASHDSSLPVSTLSQRPTIHSATVGIPVLLGRATFTTTTILHGSGYFFGYGELANHQGDWWRAPNPLRNGNRPWYKVDTFGGNQYTGTRSTALARARTYSLLSRSVFIFGTTLTMMDIINARASYTRGMLDIGFGALALAGPKGLGISAAYFVGSTVVDNVGVDALLEVMQAVGEMERQKLPYRHLQ